MGIRMVHPSNAMQLEKTHAMRARRKKGDGVETKLVQEVLSCGTAV